jgi:hypothetical protein
VNNVFTGRIHAYQRTVNVAMGKPDRKGPMHITVGAGGRHCNAAYENETAEEWIVHRDASFFGFSIFNTTHAEWRWIPLSAFGKHKICLLSDYPFPSLLLTFRSRTWLSQRKIPTIL